MSAEFPHAAGDAPAASAKVRIARRTLAPAHITRHRPGGMIYREVRAALPAVTALAAVAAIPAFLVVLESRYPGYFSAFRYDGISRSPGSAGAWRPLTLIVFLVAGVLCGAEEAENGTSDLTYRLPISPGRIYAEKTAGALLSVMIWIVLSVALSGAVLAVGLGTESKWADLPEILRLCVSSVGYMLLPSLLFFFWGQAAGAWTDRVIVGAVVGGTIALVLKHAPMPFYSLVAEPGYAVAHVTLLAACVPAMVLALIRFVTREGR